MGCPYNAVWGIGCAVVGVAQICALWYGACEVRSRVMYSDDGIKGGVCMRGAICRGWC